MATITSMESKKRRSRAFLLDDCLLHGFLPLVPPPGHTFLSALRLLLNIIGLGLSDLSLKRDITFLKRDITCLSEFYEKRSNFTGVNLLKRVLGEFSMFQLCIFYFSPFFPSFLKFLKLAQNWE